MSSETIYFPGDETAQDTTPKVTQAAETVPKDPNRKVPRVIQDFLVDRLTEPGFPASWYWRHDKFGGRFHLTYHATQLSLNHPLNGLQYNDKSRVPCSNYDIGDVWPGGGGKRWPGTPRVCRRCVAEAAAELGRRELGRRAAAFNWEGFEDEPSNRNRTGIAKAAAVSLDEAREAAESITGNLVSAFEVDALSETDTLEAVAAIEEQLDRERERLAEEIDQERLASIDEGHPDDAHSDDAHPDATISVPGGAVVTYGNGHLDPQDVALSLLSKASKVEFHPDGTIASIEF